MKQHNIESFRLGRKAFIKAALWLVCACLPVCRLAAQERQVVMPSREISVRDAMREIERQAGYRFGIGHSNFDMTRRVSLTATQGSVKDILDELLAGSGRTFRLSGNQILIIPVRIARAEAPSSGVVVLPFDWSVTYSDADFARDALEDGRNKRPGEPARIITEYRDSIVRKNYFTYSPQTLGLRPQTPSVRSDYRSPRRRIALKTSLVDGILGAAPNLALELGTGQKTSLDLYYSINYWNRDGSADDNRKKIHLIVKPELRYWLCRRLDGHFFGLHAFYWQYNVGGYDVPLMFEKEYQYEGNAFGAGISYGYHWALGRRFGVEFNAGAGVALMKYDKYECARCGDLIGDYTKTYFGPTSLGVKLVYVIK